MEVSIYFKISKTVLSSTRVDLQMLESHVYCSLISANPLLFQLAGRATGEIKSKANSAQLSWDWG